MRGGEYPFAEFRNLTAGRRTRSSQKESDNNGTSLLSSDYETTPYYIRKLMVQISMPTSMHLWSGDVKNL